MKRKLLYAFILSLLLAITAMGVSAADISDSIGVSSHRESGNITVTRFEGASGEYVFVIITDKTKTAADMTETGILTNAYAVGQCMSDSSGAFTLNIKLADRRDGEYNCIVYTSNGDSATKLVNYKSPYEKNYVLAELAGYDAAHAQEFLDAFTNAKDKGILSTNTTGKFSLLNDGAEKLEVAKEMIRIRSAEGYQSEEQFNTDFALAEEAAYNKVKTDALALLSGYAVGDESTFLAKFDEMTARGFFSTDTSAYYASTDASVKFSNAEKTELANIMIRSRAAAGYDSEETFNKDFARAEYLIALDKQAEADVFTFLTPKAQTALAVNPRLMQASDEAKAKMAAKIAATDFTVPQDLDDLISNNLVLAEFSTIKSHDNLKTLVPLYSSVLTIDANSTTMLGSMPDMAAAISKACEKMYYYRSDFIKDTVTLADIITAYQKGIADAYTEYQNGGGSGSGSGSGAGAGAGAGGGAGDSNPVVVPIVDTITPKEERERFSDLAGYGWAKDAIYKLAESGVIAGYPDGRFGPGELLTREQVVVMLVNAYQKATPGDISVFADVKDGAWYADAISYAVGSGMIAGMGDGSFGVGLSISRQDFAVMAYNAMGASYTPNGTASMNDMESVSGYARQAVEALVELGVLSGDNNGNVRPKDYTTRAEAAVILSKLR